MKGEIKRIEICGGIAAGKTTLARVLQKRQLTSIYEHFKRNPFFAAFYEDPVGNAFETEVTFMLQHYHDQKIMAKRKLSFCADFSMVLDNSYASVTLNPEELRLFRSIHATVERQLPSRTLLIRLDCAPEVELRRIRRRNRRGEEIITIDYLQHINDALAIHIKRLPRTDNVVVIDSAAINFARDTAAQEQVWDQVSNALQNA